jgi:hypothetical protein
VADVIGARLAWTVATISSVSIAMSIVADLAHDRDDLLHGRRVGGVAQSLVAQRAPGVVTRQRRRRAPPAGGIENW